MTCKHPFQLTAIALLNTLLVSSAWAAGADDLALLQNAGVEHGITVVLGCDDAAACVALHANGRYVVQVLDRDSKKVAAVRRAADAQGCVGAVSARVFKGDTMPFVDNLINLLVVNDALGVSEQEMKRVVCPLGLLKTTRGQWIKPWPVGMDEWTHFLRDASGNAVSKDKGIGPPRRLRWSAGPMWGRSHEMNNSFPALVTAKGRMFYIFDHGLTGMEDPRLGEKWTLTARDAFNGALLWEREMPTWGSQTWRSRALRFFSGSIARRLVAHGDTLYVTLTYGGAVEILAAATGQRVGAIPQTNGAAELITHGNHVFVASIEPRQSGKGGVRLTCYHSASKQVLWQAKDKAFTAQLMVAGPQELVYHNKKEIVCLNRTDGSVRWRTPDVPFMVAQAGGKKSGRASQMLLLADGRAVVGGRSGVMALSLDAGKVLWKVTGIKGNSMREYDLFYTRGRLWCSGPNGTVVGLSIADGKQVETVDVSTVQSDGHHLRCYRAKATEDYLITQYRGVEFLSLTDQDHTQNDWMRGTCTYGVMPANGSLYVPPHSCHCYAAAMFKGLNAFALDTPLAQAEREAGRIGPVEQGPAYGLLTKTIPSGKDWPSYRHDGRRTGATANQVPDTLKRRWKWELGSDLSPPIACAGRVFVVARDEHRVYALDARRGKQLWAFSAAARIDSPPSIHQGMLVFGCADGFLYCVRASDGALAWRRRLAPIDKWMAVDGQLESVWRIHGSVLIKDDLAYCTAGRSTFLDGGLLFYAVDIKTGEVRYQTCVNTATHTREDDRGDEFVPSYHIEGGHSDLLVGEGGFVYLNQMKFSPDLKQQPTRYLTKAEVTARPSINLDNKEYVNKDIFQVKWRGKPVTSYDNLAEILVDEATGVGEHHLGLHLFTTSGFLDTSFFNRTFWMYGDVWPGFNHSNLAAKAGQLLVIGPQNTYALKAYTSRYPLSPKLVPETKGYQLLADNNHNHPTLDPRAWAKDKGMGFSRGADPVWNQWIPVRVYAMTLGGQTLVICGVPDVVKTDDPMAAFEGRLGSELWTVSATDGKPMTKQALKVTPIFDGMIVAQDHVYMCTEDGSVLCLGG